MRRYRALVCVVFVLSIAVLPARSSQTRIKDITRVDGVQNNQLLGYGVVVGLEGTGDGGAGATPGVLANMLNQMGMRVTPTAIDPDNVAFVMVTAELPPYARPGTAVDVVVSSINGAENLEGGTLVFAALRGPDNKIHAIARGTVFTGGYVVRAAAGDMVKTNHATAGRIPNGGTVVGEEVETKVVHDGVLRLVLLTPDAKTAMNIKDAINGKLGVTVAHARNEGLVEVDVKRLSEDPRFDQYDNEVDLLAVLGDLPVDTDVPARVVINSRTGTVVAGENIRLDKVAIAHGSLQITIEERAEVVQPPPLAPPGAEAVVVPQAEVTVTAGPKGGLYLVKGARVKQLVEGLNALGVTTRELISIFQALKQAGALHAELIIL